MSILAALALHLFREQVRSRAYLLVLGFGGAMIYASALAGLLAVDQAPRVLLDLGLGLMELTVLAASVYGASTAILQEMETKTIYLLLTRPIARWQYLVGRFLGWVLTAGAALAAMAVLHLSLLFFQGWAWTWVYPLLLLQTFLKVVVIGALATFFSLFSTSAVAAMGFTGFFWILGHFMPEVADLVEKGTSAAAWLLKPTLLLIPDLQMFNLRDRFEVPGLLARPSTYLRPLGYALTYAGLCLALAARLFRRKEF